MKAVITQIRKLPIRIATPLRNFLRDSRAVGIILVACTVISLLLANLSSTQAAYTGFWLQEIPFFKGALHLPENVLGWVNDVLMTVFFFLVGMEIKRELAVGELASLRKSLLPVMAALGGMVCPAIIFALFNGGTPFHHGWGIPMATDIAFSLGVLSLLGKKVPIQLKIFLAALAIIDDLGAVVTIAIFYATSLNLTYLLCGAGLVGLLIAMNRFNVIKPLYYLLPGILLWYVIHNSGVHATIAGVIMAFSMPLASLAKLEHALHKPVNFIIMPLFALANTAIVLPSGFSTALTSTISFGVMAGLVIGKPLGIFLFSFTAAKLKIAALPSNTTYKQLLAIGMLGGIGFTMSIFTSTLAYDQQALQVIAKVAVIAGSVISAVAGYYYFNSLKPLPNKAEVKTQLEPAINSKEKAYERPVLEHAVG